MKEQNPKFGPTYNHGAAKPFEVAFGESEGIEAVAQHISKWVGEPARVFHELISDKVHIDVHIVEPSKRFPWFTLVTSGMSDRPMRAPEEYADCAYAELCICLPPDWPMSDEAWKQERYYWPVKALKFLARFPHQLDTWLWCGHTIPNGDPPRPFNGFTRMSSIVLLPPHCLPSEFHELVVNEKKTIGFFAIVPLYEEELELKLQSGCEVLENALVSAGHSELLNLSRKSVVPRPGFLKRMFGGDTRD